MMPADELLRAYDDLGFRLTLVPAGEKNPNARGWPHATPTREAIAQHLARGGNIGHITGPSADIDLDCPEAIALADIYLPPTGAVFGRPSKPASHRLYISPGASYANFADPVTSSTMLELRAPGQTGGAHQTLVPPSIADGEQRAWRDDRIEPATIEPGILAGRVSWLAIGCLVMRYVSEHAARRPALDLPDVLFEFDPQLGRKAYHWIGQRAPDERPPDVKPRRDYTRREVQLEDICAAITNDFGWHDWNKVGMAIYDASNGSQLGFVCFDDFSSRSPKYQPHAVRERWENYRRSPPNRIGLGTLVHLARQGSSAA